MMYEIEVAGTTRYAEFILDLENKRLTRTKLSIEDDAASLNGDVLDVHIYDQDSPSNLIVPWMVLYGDKDAIIECIRNVWPMAKLETKAIFDAFDEDVAESSVCYTYPLGGGLTPIIKRSEIYKAVTAAQQAIVSSMWNLEPSQVRVLTPENS